MLPSTGYFNGINCPFYDNGLCERPYCHFRHVKKESQSSVRDGIESGAILQKLVSAAVQKVLQQTEVSGSATSSIDTVIDSNKVNVASTHRATYNPTPISELNKINNTDAENNEDINEQRKKHIPVPYTPRKPASLPIKRPVEINGSSKPFIYIPPQVKYTPGCVDNVENDTYTPIGGVESNEKYLPGTEKEIQEYTPDESVQHSSSKRNYVPSDKNISKNKILEYKPIKVTKKREIPTVTYQPTPRSLVPCFSSDEEEPDNKRRKLSSDLNSLDDLGPEFDILDQILDEEKQEQNAKNKLRKDKSTNSNCSKENNQSNSDDFRIKTNAKENKVIPNNESKIVKYANEDNEKNKHNNSKIEKKEKNSKSHHKTKSNKKEKSSSEDKGKVEKKSKHTDKKSSHKSSSKEKDKPKKDSKLIEKKEHRSKITDQSSKQSEHSSSKKPGNQSSKSKSKEKDKSNHNKSHKSSKKSKDKDKHKSKQKESLNDLSDNDHHNAETDGIDDELYEISESDEDTIALECKKIFEEYVPVAKVECMEETIRIENINDDEYVPVKKRISHTIDKNIKITPKAPMKPDYKVTAAQAMAERLAKVREYHNLNNLATTSIKDNTSIKTDLSKNTFSTPNVGNSKIRIAHVPYASTLMNAKKTIPPNQNIVKSEPSTSTVIQTVKKGAQRVAHMPNEKFIDRPGVLEPLASKIAANIRSTYLNMMIDECLKIYLSATDAYARAQNEELATSKKCSTIQIYKNSAVLTVSRLRKELQECNGIKKSGLDCSTLQKNPDNVSGKTSNAGSWSIENKNRTFLDSQEFTGTKFYNNIQKWILTEQQLQENGFPRSHPSGVKGRATIHGQNKQKAPKGYIRTCCRCKKEYTVDKTGFPAIKEECIYHPNNKYRVRGEARYQCCSQDATSDGCCIAPTHVYEYVDFENLKGYVSTLPPESVMDDYGIYSLDCEMCYTTHGLDLTRVTVINSSCKVVYETLIKPLRPIIDYNTRYSGITEEQMLAVKTTLLDVQATLLTMFNSKTILVGHSLESDFKALKLIHDTVIDTSVLFPHKMGPPYKRALRNLSSEYLKKIIQNSVDGHDSAEDAMVCMELLRYKLKEDLKTR